MKDVHDISFGPPGETNSASPLVQASVDMLALPSFKLTDRGQWGPKTCTVEVTNQQRVITMTEDFQVPGYPDIWSTTTIQTTPLAGQICAQQSVTISGQPDTLPLAYDSQAEPDQNTLEFSEVLRIIEDAKNLSSTPQTN